MQALISFFSCFCPGTENQPIRQEGIPLSDKPVDLTKVSDHSLKSSDLTDERMQEIALKFPMIEHITLHNCFVTDAAFETISKLKNLFSLTIDGCQKITDLAMKHFEKSSIKYLSLTDCNTITKTGLDSIAKMPKLRSFTVVRGINIRIADVQNFHLQNHHRIKVYYK